MAGVGCKNQKARGKVMLYLLKKVDKEFHVLENSTGLNLYITSNEEEAHRMVNALNAGSGFDGYTPNFFVKEYNK